MERSGLLLWLKRKTDLPELIESSQNFNYFYVGGITCVKLKPIKLLKCLTVA